MHAELGMFAKIVGFGANVCNVVWVGTAMLCTIVCLRSRIICGSVQPIFRNVQLLFYQSIVFPAAAWHCSFRSSVVGPFFQVPMACRMNVYYRVLHEVFPQNRGHCFCGVAILK